MVAQCLHCHKTPIRLGHKYEAIEHHHSGPEILFAFAIISPQLYIAACSLGTYHSWAGVRDPALV